MMHKKVWTIFGLEPILQRYCDRLRATQKPVNWKLAAIGFLTMGVGIVLVILGFLNNLMIVEQPYR